MLVDVLSAVNKVTDPFFYLIELWLIYFFVYSPLMWHVSWISGFTKGIFQLWGIWCGRIWTLWGEFDILLLLLCFCYSHLHLQWPLVMVYCMIMIIWHCACFLSCNCELPVCLSRPNCSKSLLLCSYSTSHTFHKMSVTLQRVEYGDFNWLIPGMNLVCLVLWSNLLSLSIFYKLVPICTLSKQHHNNWMAPGENHVTAISTEIFKYVRIPPNFASRPVWFEKMFLCCPFLRTSVTKHYNGCKRVRHCGLNLQANAVK